MASKKVEELRPRARLIRQCFGRGDGMREFARHIGMDEDQYLKLESKGCAPRGERRAQYVTGLSRLPEVRDPEGLVLWALSGVGRVHELFLPAFVLSFGEELAALSQRTINEPAQPARGRGEQILEDAVRSALAALPTGPDAEKARKIMSGALKIVRDARQLGLASILTFAMIGGASETKTRVAEEPSSRSGGIGRRARFRVLRRVRGPARGVHNLADTAKVPARPKSRRALNVA